MITDEDYRALQINCQRMEREMKAMRQTLLDDFAKAALIGLLSNEFLIKNAMEKGVVDKAPNLVSFNAFDIAEAAVAEREKRYGTR